MKVKEGKAIGEPVQPREDLAGKKGLSGQLIAVISAAVASVMGRSPGEFSIARITRVERDKGQGAAWFRAGRLEAINSRQKFIERRGM